MKEPKITVSTGLLIFLCAQGAFDPYGSFVPYILSVILHELGHVLVLNLLKIKIYTIHGFLGTIEIRTPPLTYKQEWQVGAAGPLVNGLLIMLYYHRSDVMSFVNTILLCYNLLPFYPLDGGRILRSVLRLSMTVTGAEHWERIIGIVTYTALLCGAFYIIFRFRCGLWPIILWGMIFYRTADSLFPYMSQRE